jgi:Uma2 family endonuclease
MPIATLEQPSQTLADLVHNLGDIPLQRIRFPAGHATEKDVIRLLDGADNRIYELIDGVLVEKAIGFRESLLAAFIGRMIDEFASQHDLGIVTGADGPFRLRPGRIRFPDTSFVSWSQFPEDKIPDDAICDVVPELAVEIISEGNTPGEMKKKLRDYFNSGVRRVWYVYPKTKSAVIYKSVTKKREIGVDGALDGEEILPGFSLPLSKVFARFERT